MAAPSRLLVLMAAAAPWRLVAQDAGAGAAVMADDECLATAGDEGACGLNALQLRGVAKTAAVGPHDVDDIFDGESADGNVEANQGEGGEIDDREVEVVDGLPVGEDPADFELLQDDDIHEGGVELLMEPEGDSPAVAPAPASVELPTAAPTLPTAAPAPVAAPTLPTAAPAPVAAPTLPTAAPAPVAVAPSPGPAKDSPSPRGVDPRTICGKRRIRPGTQGCCKGVAYSFGKHGCCGDQKLYKTGVQGCCFHPTAAQASKRIQVYDTRKQNCCDAEPLGVCTIKLGTFTCCGVAWGEGGKKGKGKSGHHKAHGRRRRN